MPERSAVRLVLVLAMTLLAVPALADEPPGTRLLLSQTADREVDQDTLVAVIGAHAEADSARAAQAAVNAAMTKAVEKAKAVSGVRPSNGGYRVYQRYDRDGKPEGWIAEQDLRLESRDSAALLDLVGHLQDDGLLVNALSYELGAAARRSLEDELTIEAIAALRTRAARIAESMGMRIGRIDTVRVGEAPEGPSPRPMFQAKAAGAEAMAPPVAVPGQETVSVTVSAELRLLPR